MVHNGRKITSARKRNIVKYFNSLAKMGSHYCRVDSSKKYVENLFGVVDNMLIVSIRHTMKRRKKSRFSSQYETMYLKNIILLDFHVTFV